ncbi:micronuclear linker histone polyprotein-like protein [Tasmannia lanceolata]|uniref:micronuclear linker histone polyprotein-like protein n=1 Tax=Tasmannia lanceolata TaxID=3420 RepID=UPI004063E9AE
MKDRGKAIEILDSSTAPLCKKHPSSSSVGICAFCLKDRLIKLVCSDCGEQRLSSCSCSDISASNRNSCSVEVGSVGRISFLIENEKSDLEAANKLQISPYSNTKPHLCDETTEPIVLKRSKSSTVELKKKGFWNVGWFFKKKKEMGLGRNSLNEKGEMWVFDHMGFSGSSSVGGFDGQKVNIEQKKGGCLDSVGGFSGENESGFIDLKLGFSAESKPGFDGMKQSGFLELKPGFGGGLSPLERDGLGSLRGCFSEHESDSFRHVGRGGMLSSESSCRITVNESGIKRGKKGLKVWKWIFRHSNGRSAKK